MPDDALAIKFDFRHILCHSRAICVADGIFPCLVSRKSLKTANLEFLGKMSVLWCGVVFGVLGDVD